MRLASVITSLVLVSLASAPAALAGAWQDGVPMNNARAFSSAAVRGEDIYVAGGAGITAPQNSVEIYDMLGDIWRSGPALPEGVQQGAMASLGGLIYLSGGYLKESKGADNASLWVLDPSLGFWVSGPDMPAPRAWHGMAALGGKLYVAGGEGGSAASVLVYDPGTEKWSVLSAPLPQPRSGLALVAHKGKLYAIGGRLANGEITGRVDIFDVEAGRWSEGPALPAARAGHAAAVFGENIHVVGGEQASPPQTHATHYVLGPEGRKWREDVPLPTPRHGLLLVPGRGGVVAIGGASGPGFYTVFTETDSVNRYRP